MREGQNIQFFVHFNDVLQSLGEKQTTCIKQHAFLVDPLRDFIGFSNAHTLMLFDHPKSKAHTKKGALNLAPASKFRAPADQRSPFRPIKGAKRESHSEF